MHGKKFELAILSWPEQAHCFSIVNCNYLNIILTSTPISLPAGHHDQHHQYEFLIPLSFISRLFIGDREIECHPGNLIPINPGQLHGVRNGHRQVSYIIILFDQNRMNSLIRQMVGNISTGFPTGPFPLKNEIQMLINGLIFENRNQEMGREVIMHNLAEQLAILLIRYYYHVTCVPELIQPEKLTGDQLRFQDLITYMHEKFYTRLSINQMSDKASMNNFHFIRTFKKCFNISPYNYLTKIRINNAKCLLVQTKLPTSQIGKQCGFQSASRFSAVFLKDTGLTPSRFRKSIKTKDITTLI